MINISRIVIGCGVFVLTILAMQVKFTVADSRSSVVTSKIPKPQKFALTSYNDGDIEVKFTDIKDSNGSICAKIFNGSNGFPYAEKGASMRIARCAPIIKETGKIVFKNLPYGHYAIASIHDRNGDRKLNCNGLGVPQEGIGLSNNQKVHNNSTPSFSKSQFFVSAAKTDLQIQMQYFYRSRQR